MFWSISSLGVEKRHELTWEQTSTQHRQWTIPPPDMNWPSFQFTVNQSVHGRYHSSTLWHHTVTSHRDISIHCRMRRWREKLCIEKQSVTHEHFIERLIINSCAVSAELLLFHSVLHKHKLPLRNRENVIYESHEFTCTRERSVVRIYFLFHAVFTSIKHVNTSAGADAAAHESACITLWTRYIQ